MSARRSESPWLLWLPLAVVTLIGAVMVFRLGWISAHADEGALLNHYAQLYVDETGGAASLSDCVGRPGDRSGVRLVISCTTSEGDRRVYLIGRFGGLLQLRPAPENAPET